MIKIAALNDESDEDSDSEEEVTKEALEQIALQQYAKGLDLQRKGNLKDAMQLLKDLLDTELLYEVKKPGPGEKATEPLFNLKYLCYKNVAAIQSTTGEVEAAIESYCAASELDETDVTLWHRLGQLCLRAKRYDMALNSFQRGLDCNPRHWPCLDKIVTLLLGLGYKEDCIVAIHDALKLDDGYLRGLIYRRHIYTSYPYIKDYMEYVDKKYKWNEKDEEPMDEEKAAPLLKEAEIIQANLKEQEKSEDFKCVLPNLTLQKPITNLTWSSVGDSLVHMHKYMTEHYFSHACFIELVFQKNVLEDEKMDICDEPKKTDSSESKSEETNMEMDKIMEIGSENENNDLSDKEKVPTDTEKVESDIEVVISETTDTTATELTQQPTESKEQKKASVRRRGSDLSFLQQWEWCKRRSGRKSKPVPKETSNNIYDMLHRMVPAHLVPEIVAKKENQQRETSPDVTELGKLFEDKDGVVKTQDEEYFSSEAEQKDVEKFIQEYTETKRDIIDILEKYLAFLSTKWEMKWPGGLPNIFVEANKCYNQHIDVPSCIEQNRTELLHYVHVNMMAEEFSVNARHSNSSANKEFYDIAVIDTIGLALVTKPDIFSSDCLNLMLRHLWIKLHIHLMNRNDEFALDCLYQLLHEFKAMGEYHDLHSLNVTNFTFKPVINEAEIQSYLKFLERNKYLSTVMGLYKNGDYEEVLTIVMDSFEHCKNMARQQEEEMSIEFSVQLSIILDAYWALGKVDECFKASFTCLHEALKHFFHYTSGCQDYEKWSLTVVKVLSCMEHILNTEGLSCLDAISTKDLSQGLEDLIRIIGHQVEANAVEMPFDTVMPWILMYYILQREEDQGKGRTLSDQDKKDSSCDDVPNPLMVLFIGHEQVGKRGWCCKNDAKLIYFILDTVVPRLRSPSLSKCLEQVLQYMEQCVYCLFGHPSKKNKVKYLEDHNVTPQNLDWPRAQQLYEIFRPLNLPELEGKVTAISTDTEQLFHRILALLPPGSEPQKYVPDLEKYMTGKESKVPTVPPLLPYKMKDIYFILGDYYLKKEEFRLSIKYNMYDVLINNDRFESWAQITLAKAVSLDRVLNLGNNINNEKDFIRPAKIVIRCFKRTLDLGSNCDLWLEYTVFSYSVHSFCSRLLKQASESLSMEDFESLEKHKDEMLETAQKSCTILSQELKHQYDPDKVHEGRWLSNYFLGKVAEKRNKPPAVYMDFYLKALKSLYDAEAIYPSKINYNSPQLYSIEVLEMCYRIHATILKYIEQHENKMIPASTGKIFVNSIEEWKNGPFLKKPVKKPVTTDSENNETTPEEVTPQAANILKRSISDAGDKDTSECKKMKLESAAAKVRRSASYDTERFLQKEGTEHPTPPATNPTSSEGNSTLPVENLTPFTDTVTAAEPMIIENGVTKPVEETADEKTVAVSIEVNKTQNVEVKTNSNIETIPKTSENKSESVSDKKEDSSSSSSTSSSSSSSDSSSDSTSDSSKDSDASTKSSNDSRPLTPEETQNIISSCLEALEDCVSRFPLHYKALYRLAHYHFYYKNGKNLERCRDVMLSSFTSKQGIKTGGLFGERKNTNFFNNIWRIPISEIDRAGGFANHMNRCVLLTLEILKEIDDHKTLLDMCIHLQRIPDQDKTYLRDSDREELSQQAFSLCVQSLKGQLTKFGQQADLKSNAVEKAAFDSLMRDIYRAYQRVNKQPNAKQFTNLLVEGYKLVTNVPITENTNLVDLSFKYCQSMIQSLKQQVTQASLDKSQNVQKKQASKAAETAKVATVTPSTSAPKTDNVKPVASTTSALPKLSQNEMAAALQTYIPMLNDPMLSQQTAAALSLTYLSNISALAGYTALQSTLQSSLQNSLQNSFQAEFYRQFLGQNLSSLPTVQPPKKQNKRGPKPAVCKTTTVGSTSVTTLSSNMKGSTSLTSTNSQMKGTNVSSLNTQKGASKSYSAIGGPMIRPVGYTSTANALKAAAQGRTQEPQTSLAKSYNPYAKPATTSAGHKTQSAPLAPSMGTVLPTLPASLTATMTSTYAQSNIPASVTFSQSGNTLPAHIATSSAKTGYSRPPMPHQQVSPGKTLQEKLAERQKNMPSQSKPNSSGHELKSSLGRLPSSLTITKSNVSKQPMVHGKKQTSKKALPFSASERPKPIISSSEVIVLDDDDD